MKEQQMKGHLTKIVRVVKMGHPFTKKAGHQPLQIRKTSKEKQNFMIMKSYHAVLVKESCL